MLSIFNLVGEYKVAINTKDFQRRRELRMLILSIGLYRKRSPEESTRSKFV